MTTPTTEEGDVELLARFHNVRNKLLAEVHRAVVGQTDVLDELLICLAAGGHALLVGVPGLAKTLMIRRLAEAMGISYSRIQFTPDLMPADVTGTQVLHEDRSTGTREFRFLMGPVFAQLVLADEINRTPPKTQAALLEAMQERQVTAGGEQRRLPAPFFVLATQNPIEQEGTYPLPEAQLDRFLLQIRVKYPSETEEFQILQQTTSQDESCCEPVTSAEEWLKFQKLVRQIPASSDVIQFALDLVRMTRPTESSAVDLVKQFVLWGAGPRGGQALVLGAKARAALHGRSLATRDDVSAVARPVLRHRILLNYRADAEGLSTDRLIDQLLAHCDLSEQSQQRSVWSTGMLRPGTGPGKS